MKRQLARLTRVVLVCLVACSSKREPKATTGSGSAAPTHASTKHTSCARALKFAVNFSTGLSLGLSEKLGGDNSAFVACMKQHPDQTVKCMNNPKLAAQVAKVTEECLQGPEPPVVADNALVTTVGTELRRLGPGGWKTDVGAISAPLAVGASVLVVAQDGIDAKLELRTIDARTGKTTLRSWLPITDSERIPIVIADDKRHVVIAGRRAFGF